MNWTPRDTLVLLGRVAVVGVAVLVLAAVGRTAGTSPRPDPTQTVRPATVEEQLQHELHRQWELDQLTRG